MGERPGGTPLDKKLIVATALRLLDEVGLDGVTLRRLATELGVQAPALYWHFRNKRELLDAMSVAMVAETGAEALRRPAPGQPWWEWLAERARLIRQASLARRDGGLVMLGNRPTVDSLPVVEGLLAVLVDAGLPPDDALAAVIAVSTYTMGWVAEEQAAARRAADASAGGLTPSDLELSAAMRDRERFPLIARALGRLGQEFTERGFELGLRMMVHGLRERAERASGSGPGRRGPADEQVDEAVEFGHGVVGEAAVNR